MLLVVLVVVVVTTQPPDGLGKLAGSAGSVPQSSSRAIEDAVLVAVDADAQSRAGGHAGVRLLLSGDRRERPQRRRADHGASAFRSGWKLLPPT